MMGGGAPASGVGGGSSHLLGPQVGALVQVALTSRCARHRSFPLALHIPPPLSSLIANRGREAPQMKAPLCAARSGSALGWRSRPEQAQRPSHHRNVRARRREQLPPLFVLSAHGAAIRIQFYLEKVVLGCVSSSLVSQQQDYGWRDGIPVAPRERGPSPPRSGAFWGQRRVWAGKALGPSCPKATES